MKQKITIASEATAWLVFPYLPFSRQRFARKTPAANGLTKVQQRPTGELRLIYQPLLLAPYRAEELKRKKGV